MEKLIPNEQVAEQAGAALLGGLLRDPDQISDVVAVLREDDFLSAAQRALWRQVVQLWDARQPVLLDALNTALHVSGLAKSIASTQRTVAQYLFELWHHDPTAGAVRYNLQVVKDYALLRKLAFTGQEITRLALQPDGPAEQVLEQAERSLFALSEVGHAGQAVPLSEAILVALDRIDERIKMRQERGHVPGIPSGIPALDDLTAGWHGGELIILAARPSVGKTAFSLALARSATESRSTVLMASLEQSRAELAERMLCAESGVPADRPRRGLVLPDDVASLGEAHRIIRDLPLWVDDHPRQSLLRIAANARRFKARNSLDMLIVDYLQLIEPESRKDPRHEQVDQISRRLKALARELNIPVVALAQLNREVESRGGQKPRLSDLRESGGIEQNADVVVLLHRPADRQDLLELIVAKQRNGPTGDACVRFDRARMQFHSLDVGSPFPD